jgi:hypothetical protein
VYQRRSVCVRRPLTELKSTIGLAMYIETHVRCYGVNYTQARDVTGKLAPEARSMEQQIVKCGLHQNRGSPDRIQRYSCGSLLSGRSERLRRPVGKAGSDCAIHAASKVVSSFAQHVADAVSVHPSHAYCSEIEGLQRILTFIRQVNVKLPLCLNTAPSKRMKLSCSSSVLNLGT